MVVSMLTYLMRFMDPNSSLEKICLGENDVEISRDKIEGSGDWDSLEYQDTTNRGGKKETKSMFFHKMNTEEVSDRFVAPCFVNGLEAYDREINLGVQENMILSEYAVKQCLEHEVKRGNKIVKKELIVTLRGKIGHNKKRAMENLNFFYQDIGTSSSIGKHLTHEKRKKEAFGHSEIAKIWKDKVELNGMIMKEEEEAIKKFKGEALKEKDDPEAFIFPIKLDGQDSLEYQDTANSRGIKETKAMVFHKMDTEEVSDRFMAPCFVNWLEAYDGEINLGVEENMISNEYAVKLRLEHEVKRGNRIVKKEPIVALKGEIYFVKFIINPDEDDVEPGVIFIRSFLHMTKAITNFGAGTITIYPDIDLFLEDTEEEEKIWMIGKID
ncbi:hypothetical protein Tco_0374476 [Tanacetum coccineum]